MLNFWNYTTSGRCRQLFWRISWLMVDGPGTANRSARRRFCWVACAKLDEQIDSGVLVCPGRNRRFFFRSVYVSLAVLCSLRLLAQTPATGEAPPPTPAHEAAAPSSPRLLANSNVKLGIGDLIEISVFGVPDLTTKARISGSGDVYLPLIDYVHVADLTIDEAQELIQKRLEDGGFVRGPHVSIFVNESASQAITMVGEVNRTRGLPCDWRAPPFRPDLCGGRFTDKAGRLVTIDHQRDPDTRSRLQLSAQPGGRYQNNVDVYPGDTIIVTRRHRLCRGRRAASVSGFLVSEITRPQRSQSARTGGWGHSHGSASIRARILRQTPNGIQQIPVRSRRYSTPRRRMCRW